MSTTMDAPPAPALAPDQPPGLTDQDRGHLAALDGKFQQVRDFTAGVALGYHSGFFLHGPGGCGKSHTVFGELRRLGVSHHVYNGCDRAGAKDFGGNRTIFGPRGPSVPMTTVPEA